MNISVPAESRHLGGDDGHDGLPRVLRLSIAGGVVALWLACMLLPSLGEFMGEVARFLLG